MDTFLLLEIGLLPVSCLIVTTIHSTELNARVAVEVILHIVNKVDNLLTISYCVEECDIWSTALNYRDNNLRLGCQHTSLEDILGLVVGVRDIAQLGNLLRSEVLEQRVLYRVCKLLYIPI